jgi:hypothetical protein
MKPTNLFVTPKQVGRSLGVSESSVKSRCDNDEIAAQHTAGGHRRIALTKQLALVREGKFTLVAPEALGLPVTSGQTMRVVDRASESFIRALLEGNESRCGELIIDLHLAEQRSSEICDEVVAAAFSEFGERWATAQWRFIRNGEAVRSHCESCMNWNRYLHP